MDNFKVHRGLVPVGASREGLLTQEPFQSITSYRSQYVRHPLQNKPRSGLPAHRHHFNNFLQQFKNWSLGNKICSQAGTKGSATCSTCAQMSNLFPLRVQTVTNRRNPWRWQEKKTSEDVWSSSQTQHELWRAEHKQEVDTTAARHWKGMLAQVNVQIQFDWYYVIGF